METKLYYNNYRMNPTATENSSISGSNVATSMSKQSSCSDDHQSTNYLKNVQSEQSTKLNSSSLDRSPLDLLDSLPLKCSSNSFQTTTTTTTSNHYQPSLPCTSNSGNEQSKENAEFVTTDLEFGNQFTNSSSTKNTLLPQNTATSLSSNNNNLLDKVDSNTIHLTAHSSSSFSSCSPPLIETTTITTKNNSSITNQSNTDRLNSNEECIQQQLSTPPSSISPKLTLDTSDLNRLSNLDDNLTDKLTEKFKEQLVEHLNQQINSQKLNEQQQLINSSSGDEQQQSEDDEDCSDECSSEEEKVNDETAINVNKKRIRNLQSHSCSKKRRKQSNPVRCDYELDKSINQLTNLNQLSNQLKQHLNNESLTIEQQSNLENLKNQLNQINECLEKKKQFEERLQLNRDEPEEGLIRKFPNTLSAAANASARFFLSNHQTGNKVTSNHNTNNSTSDKCDIGESQQQQINYTYYLAAAAAVATNASLKGTKHCLNYCKECCCPFLSTEHEKLYRQLDKQNNTNSTSKQQENYEKSAFAQQLQTIVQQNKLMQEMESVFGSCYEAGQLPQRNAIEAMQLIKQLDLGQLDSKETKVYQQQLATLLNSNIFNGSSNQMAHPLSTLLAGRIFNPDAYCLICKKGFCSKYFLKTHLANKHGIEDQQSISDNKCISPTNKYYVKTHKQQQKQDNNESNTVECNQKSPTTISSPKQDNDQQLQYELMNAINTAATTDHQTQIEDVPMNNSNLNNANDQQKEIRNRLTLQMLNNASQIQQLSAVMQAEQFANILRNSLVQPNNSDLSSANLTQLLSSPNTNFLFTPERLREIGVVNPEAFCVHCCKEFCNKYFLRTHKANKHGIKMEEDECGSSCDSKSNNDQNTDKSNNNKTESMCNLDDDALEPGQCQSSINSMDLTTLLMINNLKQQQQQQQQQQNNFNQPQQLNNPQLNQQLNKDQQFSLNTSSSPFNNKEPQESADFKSSSKTSKEISCEFCPKTFNRSSLLEMHRLYSHKIISKDDLKLNEQQQSIDRNNNSNNEDEISNQQKESNNAAVEQNDGLDLSQQQSILEQQQNEELLKFQQMIKELQQHSESGDLETELLKKFALLHKQQQLASAAKANEESSSIYCEYCEKEFKNANSFRNHNCSGNENRLADSPSSMFSNLSAQMANTMLNNSNNSTLNYALNGENESLVNQTGNTANNHLNISSNGRDSLNNNSNNPLLNNLNSNNNSSNQQNSNRLSPGQNNPLLANLAQNLPQNLPSDVTSSIFFSSTAGITLDPNNKQPKFVAGRNYCNLCNKELCNKYFMKTHMLKMHNINIESEEAYQNSIIGGVMCDICKKELCSKYFLKVHKQNTHGIYEDGCLPVTNAQQEQLNASGLMTSSSNSTAQNNVPNLLVSNQSNLSPNTCLSSTNGLINQSTANSLNPLLSVYESGLSKEQQQQLQQLQIEINKQNQQLLSLKNGNSGQQQSNFLEHSSTPVSFNTNTSTCSTNNQQSTPSPNSEKELFYLQGIDPTDTSNKYFNQYTEVCPYCKRRFKSIKWMKTHISNEHQNLLNTSNSPSSNPNKNSSSNNFNKQQVNESSSDKIRCIFCTKLFSDSGLLHFHLVNDHRSSLQEMILASNVDLANNFGNESYGHKTDNLEEDNLLKLKSNKIEDQLNELQQSSELNTKNETSLNDLFNQKKKFQKKVEQQQNLAKYDELINLKARLGTDLDSEQQLSEQSDNDEEVVDEDKQQQQSNDNLSNILQLMQKQQQNGNSTIDMSGDEEPFEEDEESISEEEKFAQFQQLLLSSTTSSANQQQQPSTSSTNNKAALSIYEELISRPSVHNQSDRSPTLDDDQQDSEISDYERFSRALQQHQLFQQLKQDQLSNSTNKLAQQQLQKNRNKRSPSNVIKVYQCNICDYNTRWLSNLYAHEKRRHNTCSSSQGNLKVITIKRDIPSPINRSTSQLSLNNLLNGLENSKLNSTISNQSNRIDSTELMNQLNDLSNNQNLNNNFVNLLQSSPNDSTKPTRPIKERTASGDGQFVCTICNRSYRHKHSLHRHLVCHRNSEQNNNANGHSLTNKTNQDQQLHSPSNELNCNNMSSSRLQFTQQQSSNGTSTPFTNNHSSTGRSSSVDSVNSSEEQNLKSTNNNSQQLTNQMFSGLNQEMLESLISGTNSSLLDNLFTGSSPNTIYSPSNTPTNAYSNLTTPTTDNSSSTVTAAAATPTTTTSNSTAMFSV